MAGTLSSRTRLFGICLSFSSRDIPKRSVLSCQRQLYCLGGLHLKFQDHALSKTKRIVTTVKDHSHSLSFPGLLDVPPHRQLFSLPNTTKRKEYSERRVLGYSMEQMYEIVADVASYPEFVPWCTSSEIFEVRSNGFKARLEVGFPPIKERYISTVKLVRPNLVHAECSEGKLFSQLVNLWKFSPGIPGNPKTCTLDFAVVFEFRSILHSKLAAVFFDEIVKSMVKSFLKRAYVIHGPESIRSQKPKVLVYIS